MNSTLHDRLLKLDAEGHWEAPPGFDYFRELGEVCHHQAYVQRALNTRLSIDRSVQDASHFTELALYDPRYFDQETGCGEHVAQISIRFSAFDRMFTIFGTELDRWQGQIPGIIDYLERHGYRHIDREVLNGKYDGIATVATEDWTWFIRFFDYL